MTWRPTLRVGEKYLYGWHRMNRKGDVCTLLVQGQKMNSVLVEFEDGYKAVTSANALKTLPPGYVQQQPKLF